MRKDTQTVVSALIKQAKQLPKELYKSLTWDRGKELTEHRRFTLASGIAFTSPSGDTMHRRQFIASLVTAKAFRFDRS